MNTDKTIEDRSNRTPMVLLPYQQRWIADRSDVKLFEKSRRIGMSWTEAALDALEASSQDGMDCWYIGYNKEMAEEFIGDCGDWLKHYNRAATAMEEFIFKDEGKDILAYRIRLASGHKIIALSSRPSNLRGKQGKVIIDEAAFHDDLAGLLKAAIALLMWGGKVSIISTHNGDANPFNGLINDIRSGKKPYSLHRVTLDDALEEGLYQRICLRLGREWTDEAEQQWRQTLVQQYGDDADEELFCIPSQGGGTFLPRVLIERCMRDDIPVLAWSCTGDFSLLPDTARSQEARAWCDEHLSPLLADLPTGSRHYFGEDFARNGDLTVLCPLTETPGLTYRQPFVVELYNVPFIEQEAIINYILDRLPRFSFGKFDARGNGQYIAERAMQRYGIGRIEQVMLSVAWYREEMPRMKAFFEDGTLEIARSANHLDDYRALKMINGVASLPDTKTKSSDNRQRHGDAAIALAMAISATREDWVEYAYHSIRGREMRDHGTRSIRTTAGFGLRKGVW